MLNTFKQTIILVSALLLGAAGASAQTNTQNYVMSRTVRDSGITTNAQLSVASYYKDKVETTLQYLDGLGRPLQTVQRQGSAQGYDVVQPFAYDVYGREAAKYLPYAANTLNGSYKPNALISSLDSFYTTPPTGVKANGYPQAGTGFEASPLNRVVEQGAPGSVWQLGSGHTVTTTYGTNAASDIPLWLVTAGGGAAYSGNYYAAGKLYATTTTDENGHSTITYKDFEGHIVCKKVQGDSGYLKTCYVYDDQQNLCYVIPPIPATVTYPTSFTESDAVFNSFIYGYHYDGRNRVFKKKIPGKGWEYMVYNKIDQVVATQDSMQKTNSQWIFTKYDGQQRVIETGILSSSASRASLQSTLDNIAANLWETAQNSGNGYTNNAWPTSGVSATLTLNYYDGYNLIPGLPALYNAPGGVSTMTTGLLTASLTNVLGSSNMLWKVNYYDAKGRDTVTYAQHYLGGTANTNNYDKIATSYNFTNQDSTTRRQHYVNSSGTPSLAVTIINNYIYDHVGRKLQTLQSINGTAPIVLSQTDYNEIGQVTQKHLHSENSGTSYLQNVAYAYNERGWLNTSTSPLLNLDLRYNTADAGTQQYNGNIAEMHYTGAYSSKVFDYTYDALNRLTLSSAGSGNALNEAMNYDNMGNITGLARGGQAYSALSYAYSGNQLTGVTGTGFTSRTYGYDGNGNATSDGVNKTINYNILNLPQSLTQSSSTIATYIYDANGTKLRSTSVADSTWDYVSGIVYRNGTIAYIATEEGRAINEAGSYVYQYDLKDHLGNNRIAFDKNPATGAARELQEDEYYAFGLRNNLFGNNNSNRYLYNGKEIQTDLTNQYDYGARFYDPVIARFTTVDPLSTQYPWYTQYQFAGNEVPNAIDRDGLEPAYPEAGGTTGRFVTARDGQLSRPLTNPDGAAYLNSKTTVGAGKTFGQYAGPYKEIVKLLGTAGDAVNTLTGNTSNTTTGDKAQAAITLLQLAPMEGGEGGGMPEVPFPDNATVVGGGTNTPEQLAPKLEETHPSGVKGASVECGTCSVKELSKSIPHGKVGVTTVGDVRAAGGDVIKTSGGSPNHATMTGVSPEAASRLLNPTIKNPNKP